jgi:hypothetical protein
MQKKFPAFTLSGYIAAWISLIAVRLNSTLPAFTQPRNLRIGVSLLFCLFWFGGWTVQPRAAPSRNCPV